MKEKVLVIGAARSGLAVARLLHKHDYQVILTDMNVIKEKEALLKDGIAVFDQGHPEHLLHTQYAFVVKNPGIKYSVPIVQYFVEHHVPIYTEIEIAYRFANKFHYGAITGTNGKTTITTMLYEMLQKKGQAIVAGNIGYPLSELVLDYEEEEKDVALELSNFQLLGIEKFAPNVSVVCNLAPDHLDYMPSVESYYASKMRIYENCKQDDWFLRNIDDPLIMEYAKDIPCKIIDFSLVRQDCALHRKEGKVYLNDVMLFEENTLSLVGDYNLSNAMIAACMAYRLGVSCKDIQAVVASFQPVEHRMEYIGEKQGVRFYNDSKATNTHAVDAALRCFDANIILLAGGHDKGISFKELSKYDERIKLCVAFGETKEQFYDVFTHVETRETMKEALAFAIQNAKAGDIVLLSPACSSYDQFPNYEVRGKMFKEMVHAYLNEEES